MIQSVNQTIFFFCSDSTTESWSRFPYNIPWKMGSMRHHKSLSQIRSDFYSMDWQYKCICFVDESWKCSHFIENHHSNKRCQAVNIFNISSCYGRWFRGPFATNSNSLTNELIELSQLSITGWRGGRWSQCISWPDWSKACHCWAVKSKVELYFGCGSRHFDNIAIYCARLCNIVGASITLAI